MIPRIPQKSANSMGFGEIFLSDLGSAGFTSFGFASAFAPGLGAFFSSAMLSPYEKSPESGRESTKPDREAGQWGGRKTAI